MSRVWRSAGLVAAAGAGALAYGGLIERNWFTLRRFTAQVLDPGTSALRVLHVSDLHLTADQKRKQAWISDLARLKPDLVVNTGDTSSDPDAIPAIMSALGPLFEFPGVFVPGNNDYYVPKAKNPVRYFLPDKVGTLHGRLRMPWDELAAEMSSAGWLDLTHVRTQLRVNGLPVALAGTDDPHLGRARYDKIAGRADRNAVVRIGVIHSPEPRLLTRFAADAYDLVLAGHTHGGQIRVPFGPAIVTNCGIDVHRARWLHAWDDHMWFNVCAGLGTNPFLPIRFGCRPEAVLLTLLPRA
ncbi:metallophosphoesterase family protein [Jatrophihabitans telluris]|uniref:Metallophosphoesterase family protein n=1 Tax=Jatrophihabitans telluris TaxID=2038343 RepID=A0ABY4QZ89_9ACTN|nr:metallophosphoesterase [Jatrophihabitans telluris]UQX88171.1 metallophosphoesterase family protein [Jatrophihabitans telluris]